MWCVSDGSCVSVHSEDVKILFFALVSVTATLFNLLFGDFVK